MRRRKVWFLLLLIAIALALATLVGWVSGRRQRINPERAGFGLFMFGLLVARLAVESVRQDAPLPDLAPHNGAGERVQSRDYAGRTLVINMWASDPAPV